MSEPAATPPRRRGSPRRDPNSGARSVARRLAAQALYRLQLNEGQWKADREYFEALVRGVWSEREQLDLRLATWLDRKPSELDPVEHAVLLSALWELTTRPEVPWRVTINEAVTVTRRFGATDGHKFVNAVLDRAARELRPHEP